jgi:uncharacterized small protein (DUF1192 family)
MTVINQELYEALVAAGAPDEAAKRAAASVLSRDDLSQLATKLDIAELRSEIVGLRTEIERMGRTLVMWMVGIMGFMTTLFVVIVKLL